MTDLTIKELRSEWVEFASTFSGRGEARKYEEMFDRCLAQRDAEIQAQALETIRARLERSFDRTYEDMPDRHPEAGHAEGYLHRDRQVRTVLGLEAARLTDTTEETAT